MACAIYSSITKKIYKTYWLLDCSGEFRLSKTLQNIEFIPKILVVLISFVFMCLICIEFTGITFWEFGIAAITSEVPFGIQLD